MSDLSVRMTLTLADTASGPLRGVVHILEQMNAVANGLAARLNGTARSIDAVGRAGAGADRSIAGMTGAFMSLEAALTGAAVKASQVAAGLAAVGTEARTAGASVAAGTAAMNTGLANANTQASGLRQTMVGLAQVWAAMKIKDGFVASASGAMDYERSQTRAANMGLSAAEQNKLIQAARTTIAQVPQFDRKQALDMGIDLKNFLNSVEGAAAVLPVMARLSVNLNAAGLKPDRDVFVNVGKLLQQRDAVSDRSKMDTEVDMIGKIVAYTQGRVDVSKIVQSVQAMRATGQTVSAEFLPVLASMIEMSGGQNVQGATLYAAERYVMGNVKNGLAAKEADRLGLLNRDGLQWNANDNINLKKSELRMKGAEVWSQNPYEWVKQYLLPALQKAGITDTAEMNRSITRMFPTARAGDAISTMATQGRILEGDIAGTSKVLGQQQQYDNNMKTTAERVNVLMARLRDLGLLIGEKLLPPLDSVARAFAKVFDTIGAFFTTFPASATFLTYAAAIGTVALALAGLKNMLGIVGSLAPLLLGIGTASTASAATTTTAMTAKSGAFAGLATAVATTAATVGKFFLRMIPWVGALALAWDLGSLILNIKVGTDTIGGHLTNFWNWTVEGFRSAWKTVGEIVSSVLPAAQAREGPRRGGTASEMRAGGGAALQAEYAAANLFPDSGAGAGRGSYAGYDAAAEAASKKGASRPLRAVLGGGLGGGGGGGGGKKADIPWAITDPQMQYKADFLKSEKAAYDIKGTAGGKTAAELDELELRVKREILQTDGQRKVAEAQRLRDKLAGDLAELVSVGRLKQEEADRANAQAQAAVDIKKQEIETAISQEKYKQQLIAIDAAERNGTMTETTAAAQRMVLHKQEAAALNDLLAKELALAEARKDYEGAAKIRTAMAQNNATTNMLPPEVTSVLKTAQQGFTTFFQGILNGTTSVRKAFLDLGNSIFQSINNIIAKKLGDALFESLFPDMKGGGTFGSGGGLMQSLGSGFSGFLGSLFGGGGGAAAIGNMGATALIPGMAIGTNYVPRDMLAMLHEGEQVVPKAYNPSAGGKGGTQVVSQSFHFAGPVDRRTAMQVGADAQRGLMQARRNL